MIEAVTPIAATIQIIASDRPAIDSGALSPYPIVVIVTHAHQKPLQSPWRASLSNCSSFERRSAAQTSAPKMSSSTRVATASLAKFGLRNALRVATIPDFSARARPIGLRA